MSYFNYLTAGVEQHQWGYGIHRTTLNTSELSYIFTGAGFKNEMGDWFACVRMNADPDSPQKRRPMNKGSNMVALWFEMIHEFEQEFAIKNV